MEATSTPEHAAHAAREGPFSRAVALLRRLASAGRQGIALSSLAQQTGLPLSTVHRLLTQLLSERLAMQLEGDKRYAIGPLAYELGLVAAQQFDIRELCRPAMQWLAAESAETVYLLQRSGYEAVCLDLKQGPTTVRVVTLQIGSRRPLGLGAGGLAILAALPQAEADEVLAAVTPSIECDWHFSAALLQESLEQAREQGWALIHNRITPGVTAIGKSFNDSLGQVFGALTVAGLNARMRPERMDMLLDRLASAARMIEHTLRGQRWARYATRL
jgi:DNA-binding IclR family transcriptional regulator